MKTKTFLKHSVAILITLATLICLMSSCVDTQKSGRCTVVVGIGDAFTEYEVELDSVEITEGVFSIVKYLKEEKHLEVSYDSSSYGAYLTAIGNVHPDAAKNEYVAIYTSVTKDFDTSMYFSEYSYKGLTLGSSGFGINSMSVEADAVYLFTVGSY